MGPPLLTLSHYRSDPTKVQDSLETIGECLKHYADTLQHQDAIIFAAQKAGGIRKTVTWKELYDKSVRVAKSLIALGVKRGEIVAVNIRPCPEWLFMVFGSVLAAAVPVGIVFTYTDGSDLIAMMKKLGKCSLLALDSDEDGNNWEIVNKLIDDYSVDGHISSLAMPNLRYLVGDNCNDAISGIKTVDDLLAVETNGIQLPKLAEDEIAIMFQTSGSTGVPKLAAHTHASLMSCRRTSGYEYFSRQHRSFNNRPFNWIGGFPISVLLGQTRVTMSVFGEAPKDQLSRIIEIIAEEKVTCAFVLPPHVLAIADRQDTLPSHWPVDVIFTGGQPMAKNFTRVLGKACKTLVFAYGSTEGGFVLQHAMTQEGHIKEFCCGIPSNGVEMKVVDANGVTLPVNTRGELYLKLPGLFKMYCNDPEKTSAAFTTDGWYKTDDIGRMSETGEVFVEGRMSDVILSGGMTIVPEIIEAVLRTYPGVEEVIIVPVPDAVYYQVMCACVKVMDGNKVTEEEIRSYCERAHNDKPGLFTVLPKFYMFLENIPQTRTGKYSRKTLETLVKEQFISR